MDFQTSKSRPWKTKSDLYSFSLFVFTWHGAKKGSDRFYAWPDPLSLLKGKFFILKFHKLYSFW
ncbi:hypothetical protein FO521_10860 [Bacillus pseudomycoides]|uniref:Uncharacterized protein n=1 Tax=Bacillus pseudomycoides TaxID=64104 RepID=A0AAJ2DL61_9BACI|nr:hypothetical protein [Bacillus pseudomycoides]MDR4324612.1 hypothetical protein [Bacillus pseudomycoides]